VALQDSSDGKSRKPTKRSRAEHVARTRALKKNLEATKAAALDPASPEPVKWTLEALVAFYRQHVHEALGWAKKARDGKAIGYLTQQGERLAALEFGRTLNVNDGANPDRQATPLSHLSDVELDALIAMTQAGLAAGGSRAPAAGTPALPPRAPVLQADGTVMVPEASVAEQSPTPDPAGPRAPRPAPAWKGRAARDPAAATLQTTPSGVTYPAAHDPYGEARMGMALVGSDVRPWERDASDV
jgi:hypothetical protein